MWRPILPLGLCDSHLPHRRRQLLFCRILGQRTEIGIAPNHSSSNFQPWLYNCVSCQMFWPRLCFHRRLILPFSLLSDYFRRYASTLRRLHTLIGVRSSALRHIHRPFHPGYWLSLTPNLLSLHFLNFWLWPLHRLEQDIGIGQNRHLPNHCRMWSRASFSGPPDRHAVAQ